MTSGFTLPGWDWAISRGAQEALNGAGFFAMGLGLVLLTIWQSEGRRSLWRATRIMSIFVMLGGLGIAGTGYLDTYVPPFRYSPELYTSGWLAVGPLALCVFLLAFHVFALWRRLRTPRVSDGGQQA